MNDRRLRDDKFQQISLLRSSRVRLINFTYRRKVKHELILDLMCIYVYLFSFNIFNISPFKKITSFTGFVLFISISFASFSLLFLLDFFPS